MYPDARNHVHTSRNHIYLLMLTHNFKSSTSTFPSSKDGRSWDTKSHKLQTVLIHERGLKKTRMALENLQVHTSTPACAIQHIRAQYIKIYHRTPPHSRRTNPSPTCLFFRALHDDHLSTLTLNIKLLLMIVRMWIFLLKLKHYRQTSSCYQNNSLKLR